MHWQLNRVIYPVQNLGPGKRLVIWVQGCALHCHGCISPDLWPVHGGRRMDVAGFASAIVKLAKNLDGITITGGEPFDQYRELVAFSTFVKKMSKLNILVFSGHRLDELMEKFPDRLFMKCIDFLVDGPYIRELHDHGKLRGSSNQLMYRFEPDVEGNEATPQAVMIDVPNVSAPWSVKIDNNNNLFMTGIPGAGEADTLTGKMKNSGVDFEIYR